jgi:hypothetical protein
MVRRDGSEGHFASTRISRNLIISYATEQKAYIYIPIGPSVSEMRKHIVH